MTRRQKLTTYLVVVPFAIVLGFPFFFALVTAFNGLQIRLAQLLRARMSMLGGISHDVRTFATRLRLRVEQMPVLVTLLE